MSRFPIIPALDRPVCTKPCNECPFRRKAMPGWLGAGTPQSFIVEISLERPLPCHLSIDYEEPGWLERWNASEIGKICAGALILSRNMGKLPRDPKFPRMPSDKVLVFSNHLEFIAHHEGAIVRSWETNEQYEIRKPKIKRKRRAKDESR